MFIDRNSEKEELWVPSCGKACPTTANLTYFTHCSSPAQILYSCMCSDCMYHFILIPFLFEAFIKKKICSLFVTAVVLSLYLPLCIFFTFQDLLLYPPYYIENHLLWITLLFFNLGSWIILWLSLISSWQFHLLLSWQLCLYTKTQPIVELSDRKQDLPWSSV